MVYGILADLLVVLHLFFILFVIGGGLLALKWKKVVWVHIPVALWGVFIEYSGWICPLTPWENYFRSLAGREVYQGDFIGRYLLPIIYPDALTREIQLLLGSIVLLLNLVVYAILIRRYLQHPGK